MTQKMIIESDMMIQDVIRKLKEMSPDSKAKTGKIHKIQMTTSLNESIKQLHSNL